MTLEKKQPLHSGTRCSARRKNGEPCRNWAILGASVCRMHGGSAPQVRRAAQVRLAMATEVLVERLLGLAESGDVPAAVQLAAIRDALDRANVVGTQQMQVEVGVSQWDQMKSKFIRTVHIGELEAKALETVVNAELIEEDSEYEAELDEERRQSEALRGKRKRQGHPASLPSEDPAPRLDRRPPAPSRPPTPEPADFAAEPPTRKTDAEWRAEGLARARQSDSAERRTARRGKRR